MADGSTPNWITGYAPPATEWNLWWGKKYDATSNLAGIAVTATGGTTARQLGDRFADAVNVKDFGAKGDGTTDDAAAINAAIASFRSLLLTATGTTITNGIKLVFPRGTYLCKSPLNFTNLQGIGNNVTIDFSGAVLRFNLSGQVCVDALGSTQIEWRNLAISVVASATPTIGLQIGRFATNQVASKHTFIAPEVVGTFTKCAVYNFGSEENLWLHPQFANLYANTSAYVLIMDGWNHWTCTSTFVTQQLAANTQQPFGQNSFIKPDFRNTGGGPVVWMMGSTNGRYEGIYTYTVGAAPAFVFYAVPGLSSIYRLYIQGHFESDFASPNNSVMLFTGTRPSQTVQGLTFIAAAMFFQKSVFALDTGVTALSIQVMDFDLLDAQWGFTHPAVPIFDTPAAYTVSGKIKIGGSATLNWNLPTANFQGDLTVGSAVSASSSALSFGSKTATAPNDLTKHIALWGTTYGLSITGSRLNYVSAAAHWFVVGSTDITKVDATGLTVGTNTAGYDMYFNGAAGDRRSINWQTAGLSRWRLFLDGSDNLTLGSFDTKGSSLSGQLAITANPGVGGNNSAFTFGGIGTMTLSGAGQSGYLFKHKYSGTATGNTAVFLSNISGDTISAPKVWGHRFAHSFGGTGASGARIGLEVNFQQAGPIANGSNVAMIINATVNNPGGTSWTALDSQLVGQNWNTELKQGALYFGVYKALGECDVSVDPNTAVVTIGAGSPVGTTYSLSFTTTATYQIGIGAPITTPVVISVIGVTGDTTMVIASKLAAAIQMNDQLNQAGIGVSAGQVAATIFTTGSTGAFSLAYADWVGMTVTPSVSGGAGTLTVGAEVKGAGANQVRGLVFVASGNHGVRGLLSTSVFVIQGTPSTGSAGTFSNILKVEGGPGGGGLWPLDPYCTAFQFTPGGILNTTTARVAQSPTRMASFLDARRVNFTQSSGAPFMLPGFRVDGTGALRIGGGTITRTGTGLLLNAPGWEGTAVLAGAGSGTIQSSYAIGDIGSDSYDGQYLVTAIDTAGRITSMTTLNAPSAPAGTAPSTTQTVTGGSGAGWTVTVTWKACTNVAVGSAAVDTIIGKQSAGAVGDTLGHLLIPFVSGTPTGVPANASKGIALRYDTTANVLWAYSSGWKSVVGATGYLPTTGGTLTGALILNADPSAALGASTKQYVDATASGYLPLAGGTVTGTLNVGNNTTSQLFVLNGAVKQTRQLQMRTANSPRWQIRCDAGDETGSDAGSDLIIQGYTDGGVGKGTLLSFDRLYGAQQFNPYATVFSGSDQGTPGLTMSYSMKGVYSGSSTTPTAGITFNRWWVTQDTVNDQQQGVYFHFQGDYGPATTIGGRTALQAFLRTVGDISSTGAATLTGFRSHVQANNDGSAATSSTGGGAVQGIDINPELLAGATGWGQVVIAQMNATVAAAGKNNLFGRKGIFVSTGMDPGTQGGRHDAAFSVATGPAAGSPNPTYPAPGMGWRYLMAIGNGGNTTFALDYFNGEVLGTLPPIVKPPGATIMPQQTCLHGINLAKVNFGESAWWSPGVKIAGNGTTRITRLQISAGTNGPVIDAPLRAASITSISSSSGNLYVGEQVYDHLGGIAIVDAVNANNNATAAHYLYPPNVAAGDVVTVASGLVSIQANVGDTIVHLKNGTYGMAVNDTVVTANSVAGVPGGTTMIALNIANALDPQITLSAPLTAILPVGTMLLFRQTMPSTTVTFRTGSTGYFAANVTWAAATSIQIGSSAVATTIGGTLTLPLLTNAASDSAAAAAGVAVGQLYRNASVLMQRVS